MTVCEPIKLCPQYQRYPWGTKTAITDLLDLPLPPGESPVAELWMGAHPALPSPLAAPVSGQENLLELINHDPEAILGHRYQAWQSQLPYLFKVLSAGQALSIQVHPSKAQAEAGFAAENARGIALSDPARNYKDANHKPELLLALTEFHAMAGFRQPAAVAERLARLDSVGLQAWSTRLVQQGLPALGELYAYLLNLTREACQALLKPVLTNLPKGEDYVWVQRLYDIYGDDPGVLFPLLLNRFQLSPGEAIALRAGVPHAYLEGTGLEVMASSDNVLRGGLTSKHMDVPELLRVTDLTPDCITRLPGDSQDGVTRYPVPYDDFQLELLAVRFDRPQTLGTSGCAELLLQLSGESQVSGQSVQRGEIVLLPAALGEVDITGDGRLARVFTRV